MNEIAVRFFDGAGSHGQSADRPTSFQYFQLGKISDDLF